MSTSESTPVTTVATPTDAQLKALKTILKMANELASSWGIAVEASGRKSGKAPKAASKASSDKPKRTLDPEGKVAKLNQERMTVFAEMRDAWISRFPQFTEQARAAWAPDASAAVKKAFSAAVKAAGAESAPMFADALKEHSRRRAAVNPEAAAKHAAYRAKVEADQAERKSQGSKDSGSVVSAPAVATETSGKGKRKAQTPEQKAAAKATRDAKKAAAKATTAPAPAPEPTPVVETSVVKADDGDEEAFKTWRHKDKDYFKNGLNYVYSKNSKGGFGDYVGQYDPVKRSIDKTIPEPDADSDGSESE